LQTEAKEAALAIQHDPATVAAVRTWIRDTMEHEMNHIALDAGASAGTTTKPGVGERLLRRVRKMIATRLAIESADQTGQIDYASIHNGATVLSSSPSLVDNLPIINRLAALMSLRFYGYGPEAALTPTHPPNALGQCWAFEKQAHRKAFATLTVRLAESVYVESVLIEHPPKELSDRVDTAIRTFHLTGFEHDQSGKAWSLGSFEYTLSDDSIRQEFPVADEVDGEDVPALRVIRLQIDSNWGAKYACLYRFRVHGQEKEDV
jgi:Sad1 / UNC-like C-terminal